MASDWPRTFLQPGCFCLAYNNTENTIFVIIRVEFHSFNIHDSNQYILHFFASIVTNKLRDFNHIT